MEIRAYAARDMGAAIKLWNACMAPDAVDEGNFCRRVLWDVNFDPNKYLLAWEGGRPLGFIYGTKRRVADESAGVQPENGWVVAMGVLPEARRRGIGRALLARLEAALIDEGAAQIDVGPYATNYFSPGVDTAAYADGVSFFIANGYGQKGESHSMDICLRGREKPKKYADKKAALEAEGWRFAWFTAEDTLPLFEMIRANFPWWISELRGAVTSGRAGETLLLAHDKDGAVGGFVMRALDGSEGRFGPFGVSPELQGVGLGGVLFHEMMESMAARRIFYSWFLWTGGRNLDIYGGWGMRVYRSYAMLGKAIQKDERGIEP